MNNKINLNDISIPNDNYDESDILKNYSLDKEWTCPNRFWDYDVTVNFVKDNSITYVAKNQIKT